jgi:hypothetical protein
MAEEKVDRESGGGMLLTRVDEDAATIDKQRVICK